MHGTFGQRVKPGRKKERKQEFQAFVEEHYDTLFTLPILAIKSIILHVLSRMCSRLWQSDTLLDHQRLHINQTWDNHGRSIASLVKELREVLSYPW